MLKNRTVLVLGAGSSFEFGLPVGEGLAKSIAAAVNFQTDGLSITHGEQAIWRAATDNQRRDVNQCLKAGQLLSQTLPLSRSIDDLLYNHGHNDHAVRLGKLGIAWSILRAERGSRLAWRGGQDPSAALHSVSESWLHKLFRFLWTGVRRDELAGLFEGLSIINFNYDRCVEHFLLRAVQVAYDVTDEQAQEAVRALDIVHPYGQVGRLPWQRQRGPGVEFGAEHVNLEEVAAGIKTFTEQAHDPEEVKGWRDRLRAAEQIVFLGFAYHPQNMELLDVGQREKPSWPRAYGTVFGMADPELELVRQRVQQSRGMPPGDYSEPVLRSLTCAQFVDDYGAVLMG